jgi:hypothetical protein
MVAWDPNPSIPHLPFPGGLRPLKIEYQSHRVITEAYILMTTTSNICSVIRSTSYIVSVVSKLRVVESTIQLAMDSNHLDSRRHITLEWKFLALKEYAK